MEKQSMKNLSSQSLREIAADNLLAYIFSKNWKEPEMQEFEKVEKINTPQFKQSGNNNINNSY